MPTFRPSPDLGMHYEDDDFTDPWLKPETILMLHGNAESGLAWWAWVPKLARQFRVVRPDMRAWQEQIKGSELVVLPGNSYHVAATHADPSAAATLDFIARRGG
jgi:pimeloyl-ACP methyl ester carboxylesterase